MLLGRNTRAYRSIFSPNTRQEREQNFDLYWQFSQAHSGELLETERDLTRKRDTLWAFQAHPVRARQPLHAPEVFYRNYVRCQDPLASIDRKTLLLMAIYKVARQEWVGITGAWDAASAFSEAHHVIAKIGRYHLAEEFGHIRLFHEMFVTFHLDGVMWVPLTPVMQRVYQIFPRLPGTLLDPPAFVTELMGLMFYRAVDTLLDDVFSDEPEACQRVRELLHEITVDELAHIGQRRNFLSPRGVQAARWLVRPMFRAFFRGIPESPYLFDVTQMIQDALAFDYNDMPLALLERSWVPTYCRPAGAASSGEAAWRTAGGVNIRPLISEASMAVYAIGDVQGCFTALLALLDRLQFDRTRDRLWFAGDLVNRGPQSLEVLRFVKALGDNAVTVLGNHDLHLLSIAYGQGRLKPKDTLADILTAPDRDDLLTWLRHQPLLHHDATCGMTLLHAGLPPQWTLAMAQDYAAEVEAVLRGPDYRLFLENLRGPAPDQGVNTSGKWERLRYITHCLTRLRFCDTAGRLNAEATGPPGSQPPPYLPWFAIPHRASADLTIIFGHWSALGLYQAPGVYGLDTGCVWGGTLTALCLETRQLVSVACGTAQAPSRGATS